MDNKVSRQTMFYVIVSACVVGVNFVVFAVLVKGFGITVEVASVTGAVLGIAVGFVGHSKWTWPAPDGKRTRWQVFVTFCKYLATYAVQICASVACLSLLTRVVKVDPLYAYWITAVVITVGTFVTLKWWVFTHKKKLSLERV